MKKCESRSRRKPGHSICPAIVGLAVLMMMAQPVRGISIGDMVRADTALKVRSGPSTSYTWLDTVQAGETGVVYALNQWHKLCLANKHSPTLDNNAAENAVRPLKLGAKNWLFIGGEDTGWRSAIIYTLVENCRILGHDPYAYLKWVFEKIPSMTNQDDLRQLLPAAWASQLESSKASEAAA